MFFSVLIFCAKNEGSDPDPAKSQIRIWNNSIHTVLRNYYVSKKARMSYYAGAYYVILRKVV
jgi:hypothetical protein